ncbi:DUF493 family protein [Bacillus thuringiensis]|uniref:DUF493 family protein n=1 Tax=Bacillus thuringiensis TaxID=1428 RepID=UPI000BF422C9|nr:DUF493 family protein [Bacillus thuringiensis]PFS32654.1 hypothetical protein COK48_21530 [Bacillus thuringiensis]
MEKYPVEFTIISPNSEVYEPDIVYITANTPDIAIKQVEKEIESRMGKYYTYKVKISIQNEEEQLSLF